MKKLLKWVGFMLGGLVGLVVIAATVIYVWSSVILNRTYEFEPRSVAISSDSDSLALGEKVARTRGCVGSCHGPNAQGEYFVDEPWVVRIIAPNLTRRAHEWSVEDLDRSIRQGLRSDGTSVFGMPAGMLQNLSDEDFGALIAYLRSLPRSDRELDGGFLGLPARLFIVQGRFLPERTEFDRYPHVQPDPADAVAHGKYLAHTTCTECHGPELYGWGGDDPAPALIIASAYSPEAFERLMKTGESLTGRDLGLMKEVARGRFSHYTSEEIGAIYAYLTSPEFRALKP